MKIRPLGDITTDMEPLLREMSINHDMQVHEILGIVYMYLITHCPESIEEYEDGSRPVLKYE